jgi:hypothetical protein
LRLAILGLIVGILIAGLVCYSQRLPSSIVSIGATERHSQGVDITRLRIQTAPKSPDVLYLYLNGQLVTFVATSEGNKFLNREGLPPHEWQGLGSVPYVVCGKGGSIEQP